MIAEGSYVKYVGDGYGREAGLVLEDEGKVVSTTTSHSHVIWRTGSRVGQIDLISNMDLVVARQASVTDDSLDSPIVSVAAQQVYEEGGAGRLLSALIREGHTAGFAAIADEVVSMVSSLIRQDPSFRAVLSQLDSDAGSDLVSHASMTLLRDAFREVA